MSKSSLADLRARAATKPTSYPTRILPDVCLDQEATAKVQRLVAEKNALEAESRTTSALDDAATDGPPKKMGEGRPNPRIAELDAEIEACWAEMRPSSGELLLMGIDGGEWLRWKDAHPPRKDNQTDDLLTFGMCNAVDLAADLGRYVKAWNGEELGPDDWSGWMSKRVSSADQGAAVRAVVEMHETRLNVPKSQKGSSATEPAETA